MSKYIISSRAEQDLAEITTFIADDNIAAALALIDRFTHVFETLVQQPMIGRERPELNEGLRSFPDGTYSIFYRIWAGEIAIVRVIHAARDLDQIFD